MSQPSKIPNLGSKDGDACIDAHSMDESEHTTPVAPVDMPPLLRKHQGSREFHAVPELKDYVSGSYLPSRKLYYGF